MGASGKLFMEERERHLIEVPGSYYEDNIEFFKYPKTKHIRTIVTADEDMFKNDPTHAMLLSDYIKSSKKLQDYKYDKRHNFKNK